MDGLQPGRGGRGKPVSRDGWPPAGAQRDWLAYCDKVRRENGLRSLRALGKEVHLSFNRVGELLRGEGLPVDEEQARAMLAALGATDGEIRQGTRLYGAARAEHDQAARAADPPDWWQRSAYFKMVCDTGPDQLLDREAELAELARWCTGGDEAYVRWQAGLGAGKSALMSWLVRHPPPGTWVVSFFVTGTLASQADSTAFTDSLLDQLAAITGDRIEPGISPSLKDGQRQELLEKAAAQAVKAGRLLLLVVDGLDEDRGSRRGSGVRSIAACLPRRPPDGLRVIVASRPDPPLPGDVIDSHPLRHCRVRQLDVSPHAIEAIELARRELDAILDAGNDRDRARDLSYQVLGLITASGGGLENRDLQQLTKRPESDIRLLLNGALGRTIAARPDVPAPTKTFVFTHESLHEEAIKCIGDALGRFVSCLDKWADGYRNDGWPASTPAYLLHGYPRMLADAGHLDRLADLATDPARSHRMLDATGGDAAALAEIATAHALISTSPSPDLLAALRLARHRDLLASRNDHFPAQLPALWVTLGQPGRAEALARSITDEWERALALSAVATAVAEAGDRDRARELAADAERIAQSITNPDRQEMALAAVAAGAGDYDRAERIARSITYPEVQAHVLAVVATAAAEAGDRDRARELAADIERIARSITYPEAQARTLAVAATAVAGAGDRDRARELAADAERIARSTTDPDRQEMALVTAAAGAGDYDRAERIARSITNKYEQPEALAEVATAAAEAGDYDRARELAADIERIARSISSRHEQAWTLAGVATAVAWTGDYDRAEQIARSIATDEQGRALARVAAVVAGGGDYDRAEQIARSITNKYEQPRALAEVATAAAEAGDRDRARELAADIERIARSGTDPEARARALVGAATVVAWTGDYDRAEQIARSSTYPEVQPRALAGVATAAAGAGDRDRARELAADAERIARSITKPHERARALAEVAMAVAGGGDYDRAERIARSITYPYERARALAGVASSVAEPARARACIMGALAAGAWTSPLEALALVDPAALSAFAGELTASLGPVTDAG